MAPRLARSSVQVSAPKNARTKHKKRSLDAYAIASHSAGSNPRIRRNRLGEYLDDAPKQKRRRVVNDQDDDEESVEEDVPAGPKWRRTADEDAAGGDEGSDSEGNEWRLGGLRTDDDDSELDSDEAFGESDEERFEGFTFRGSKSSTTMAKPAKAMPSRSARSEDALHTINLEEEDDEDDYQGEDEFGSDGVELATMLDEDDGESRDNSDMSDVDAGNEGRELDGTESEAFGESELSRSDGEDEGTVQAVETYEDSEEDSDQYDEERAARTRDHVDALDLKPEISIAERSWGPLNTDDLAATFDTTTRKEYEAAKRARKKSGQQDATSVPLPKRQQDRLDREVATQKAKEQFDRWRDTVIHNRRAEFLSFPLKHADESEPVGKDKFIVDGQPHNELEESIQRIMQESGLSTANGQSRTGDEAGIIQAEDLAINKLPVEEVMRRRAELRRTRDLLFREERKAKRVAKIKSKSYRRVHRKERERQAAFEDEMIGTGDEEEKRETNDRKRAMARMSTKHRDSKFAKALKETNRGVWDEDAREAVLDEARRKDELERRIRGKHVREEDDESDIESEDGGSASFDEFDGDQSRALLNQINRIQRNGGKVGNQQEENGLQALKFMRAADERMRARNDEDVERVRKELAVQDGEEEGSEGDDIASQGLGRAVFGPKGKSTAPKKVKRTEMDEGEESEVEEESGGEEVAILTERRSKNDSNNLPNTKADRPLSNGDLGHERKNPDTFLNGQARHVSSWITGEVGKLQSDKSEWRTAKTDRGKVTNAEPINVDITERQTEANPITSQKGATMLGHMAEKHSGLNHVTNGTTSSRSPASRQQSAGKGVGHDSHTPDKTKEYHARAFAGDDTAAEFVSEKSALARDEDEKEQSSVLPGWGSWTGAGLSKSLRRANARTRHNPLYKTKTPGVAQANRKDADLENVIISEKTDRKGKGYLAPILPHGFETKEQYERSLRLPVGPEWSTKEVFQQGTRPRVVVKPGAVVEAMKRPMV